MSLPTFEIKNRFTDAVQMDGKTALKFWRAHKTALLALAASDMRGVVPEVAA
ncbi:MAG TPA: hypothetical protein VMV54_06065 [Acidocella sp.]|nr:hypothetical protein [Acidocella sp.]